MSADRNTIAVLEDDAERQAAMRSAVACKPASTHQLVIFDNAPDMIRWLDDHLDQVLVISLDHDLGPNRHTQGRTWDPGTGRDVADFLAGRTPCCPVIVATTNTIARPGMVMVLEDAGWHVRRVLPLADTTWIASEWLTALALV